MFLQARYLVERQDGDVYAMVLDDGNEHRKAIIEQLVNTALPESKHPEMVRATFFQCKAFKLLRAGRAALPTSAQFAVHWCSQSRLWFTVSTSSAAQSTVVSLQMLMCVRVDQLLQQVAPLATSCRLCTVSFASGASFTFDVCR